MEIEQTLITRIAEIAIKSPKTRRNFTNLLIRHIRHVLHLSGFNDAQIINKYSRIYIKGKNLEDVSKIIASLIPGIASVSLAYEVKTDKEIMKEVIEKKYKLELLSHKTFAVRVKRTGKHSFTSMELAAELGKFILDILPELKVNLTNPEYILYLEVRDKNTFIFNNITKGLGGLPACSQGPMLVLCSNFDEDLGNILQFYKRGAEVIPCIIHEGESEEKLNNFIHKLTIFSKIQSLKSKTSELSTISTENKDKEEVIKQILEIYNSNDCLALGMNDKLFWQYQEEIPVSIPVFVPNMVVPIDIQMIKRWNEITEHYTHDPKYLL